jgi:hypothetical protein
MAAKLSLLMLTWMLLVPYTAVCTVLVSQTLSKAKFDLLKTCIHISKHVYEKTPRNSFYIFQQQGNLLHF